MAPKNVILAALAALILPAVCLQAQTRSLIYNATNGQVIANTGTNVLTFTNSTIIAGISINENGVFYGSAGVDFDSGMMRKNGGGELFNWSEDTKLSFALPIEFSNTTNAATTRANFGFSTNLNTLWTATNASNARSAVGLAETNSVSFAGVTVAGQTGTSSLQSDNATFSVPVRINTTNGIEFWGVNSNAARVATRANLFPDVTALTNTSNVTMMRALSGSTNTNHPFSGTVDIIDGNMDSHNVTISNGIIVNWQAP